MTTSARAFAAALALAFVGGAAAADDMMDVSKMTCADYMALDDAGKMSAMEAIEAAHAAMASGDTMAADDTMSPDTMSSDTMGAAADNPMVAEIIAGCDGHPEMMAMDAMGSM